MNDEKKTQIEEVIKVTEEVVDAKEGQIIDVKREERTVEIKEEANQKKLPKNVRASLNFLKQRKITNLIIIVIFLVLLIWSSSVRLQNLPLLKDSTTGEYIPLALDPFYFLRVAETMLEGPLPEFDAMRYPSLHTAFSEEILPSVLVFMYKITNIFSNDISMRYIDVIYPVVFFCLGLIVFFFLIFSLTKSKWTALLSSVFLAVIPPYLYRTMAGFADHEAIGMFAFFATLLVITISLKSLSDINSSLKQNLGLGLLLAFASAFTIVAWGGIAAFIFMIVPLTFLVYWLINSKDLEGKSLNKKLLNILLIYAVWFAFTVLFGNLLGFSISSILSRFILGSTSILGSATLLFMVIDYLLIINWKRITKREPLKYRILLTGAIVAVFGGVVYNTFVGGVWNLFNGLIENLLHPFGIGRIGLTVAENKQPYLVDWFSQIGKNVFWLFYAGIIFVGINIAKEIRENKHKIFFSLAWILFISGILFSRISAASTFNGENFISQLFYFLSALILIIYSIWLYLNNKIHIKNDLIIIAAWLIPMLIAARGAIRLFFAIVPFMCFMISYLLLNLTVYYKKNKGEMWKFFLIIGTILVILLMIISLNSFTKSVSAQAKFTGPSANYQWQQAMSWVRENTPESAIFVHWWDYGYWIQYLGKRPTVTDGGHAIGFWDHLIGRYLLTTPKPETSISFMKTHNVSYLLIDPTDIGKYSAYSSIGSDNTGNDRFSWIPLMLSNPNQIQEVRNGEIRFYQGGSSVDEDIFYLINDTEIFLPSGQAGIAGVLIETQQQNNSIEFIQPRGVFVYNGQQIQLPLRYLEHEGQFKDFKNGIEATIKIIPKIDQSTQSLQIDDLGALMYLSPKVTKGLVAQLYLMNDPLNNYPTLELAHAEPDPAVSTLKTQGANLKDFMYYNGLRGPIKIWKVDYPESIIVREEFLRRAGDWGELDNLSFTK